jgi:hypothetical protein
MILFQEEKKDVKSEDGGGKGTLTSQTTSQEQSTVFSVNT